MASPCQGELDRIDDRDGELVIVDYKTGRRAPDDDAARGSLALALYALGAARIFRRPCRRVELHHLPSGTVAGFVHTDQSLERHVRRAQDTADDIVAATDTLAAGAAPTTCSPRSPGRTARGVTCAGTAPKVSAPPPRGIRGPGWRRWRSPERMLCDPSRVAP